MIGGVVFYDGLSLYEVVLLGIFAGAGVAFVLLLFVSAPYGRFARSGWGVRLPERWAWLFMELPSLLLVVLMAATGRSGGDASWVLLGLWAAHYLYRSLLYPALLPAGRRRSMPLLVMLMAIGFNVSNGFVNGHVLFHQAAASGINPASLRFVVGVIVFFAGATLHVRSDSHLRALRRAGAGEYSIPRRGLFRFVSCPNYLGEIVEWIGFAIAAWTLPAVSFAVFTAANLVPRALSSHRWYRAHFADYPEERRAIIPWLL